VRLFFVVCAVRRQSASTGLRACVSVRLSCRLPSCVTILFLQLAPAGKCASWRSSTTTRSREPAIVLRLARDIDCAAQAEVWRVEWNVTGSTLASSGDDGTSRTSLDGSHLTTDDDDRRRR
jgi:hypothetical protein